VSGAPGKARRRSIGKDPFRSLAEDDAAAAADDDDVDCTRRERTLAERGLYSIERARNWDSLERGPYALSETLSEAADPGAR
jgi:hypothetical protein